MILLCWAPAAVADEYRAFWVDAWGESMRNETEVETLLGQVGSSTNIGRIREANCNSIFVQVRRRADVCYPSAVGEPYMSGLSPSNFNALQAMIDAAHDTTGGKQYIEVHAWIVVFKTRDNCPLYLNHNNPAEPDNYWITRYDSGSEPADKPLDPGHPRASEYLTEVCMDLVNNFDIDGLHYDYIRFAAVNEGYNPTSIARYNARYGLAGQPSASNEQFKQWRRDQVTQFVRRVYAHVLRDRPEIKVSGAFVTWNPSPTSSTRAAFMGTRPYYDVFSDWDAWTEEGIIDLSVPMTYYNQASLPSDFSRWMNFQKDRKFNRQNIVGPGIYLNSLSNAITQLNATRDASPGGHYADGFCGYSYRAPFSGGTWSSFAPSLVANVTPTPDSIPEMPWKSAPTKGHIMGTVTDDATDQWVDGAEVEITGPESRTMICDGTGFYAFIDLLPGTYDITVTHSTLPSGNATVSVSAGYMTEQNLQLGSTPPIVISNVQATGISETGATITWNTDVAATSRVEYGLNPTYGQTTTLDPAEVTSHSVTLNGLAGGTLYHYRAISTNGNGSVSSQDFTFTTIGAPVISNIQIASITADSATITWDTSAPADSQIEYGLTDTYGLATAVDPTMMTSHSVTITGLSADMSYHFRVRSAGDGGISYSTDQLVTTIQLVAEIVIDNTDPQWANTSPGGNTWDVGLISNVPKIGSNYLYAEGVGNTDESAATHKCTWTPDLPVAGLWDVYAYYQCGSNRSNSAPFKVIYDGGELLSIENQNLSTSQSDWYLIGQDLPFAAGNAGYLQCSTNSADTNLVSADAAKFIYKGSSDTTPPTTPVVTDDGITTTSLTELHATWTSGDPETGITGSTYRIIEQGNLVRDWTDLGPVLHVTATGLTLETGKTYVFEVRTTNGAGMTSITGVSDGISVFRFDIDGDGHVDQTDTDGFVLCQSGAMVAYPDDAGIDCSPFDSDLDGDVDQSDFGAFQNCLTGAGPLDIGCLGG